MKTRSSLLFAALLMLIASFATTASATTEVPKEDYQRALDALSRGDTATAILELESLADSGVLHPDVSFTRGIAYARHAREKGADPGDLGRAAAAFEETVRMRHSDAEAERALDSVRAEVARRRSRQDKNDVIVRPSLDRVVLQLFTPAIWSLAAMGASLLLGIGLMMRWKKEGWVHITGSVVAPLAFVALLILAPIAYFARDYAETRRPGVVVVAEGTLVEETGEPTPDAPKIPEASLVELGERHRDKVLVRWGNYEGWLPQSAVRTIVTD
ncbi:MAG: hypothetical protein HOW73_48210 [Polyangiaceae bacterium]|nr:hypothetical protein [Polyangiaceae bacterium]